jgi:hypothetical protein
MFCWGDGGMFLTLLCPYIFICICFDPFILIIIFNYPRDNSVIFPESFYWREGWRPRYGINPLKPKHRPLYLKTQSVPRCKHFSSRL